MPLTPQPAPGAEYPVTKNGVRFRNAWYMHANLNGHVGRMVTVRFLETDRSFIDVYLDGSLLCTCSVAAGLSREQRRELARVRRNRLARLRRLLDESDS